MKSDMERTGGSAEEMSVVALLGDMGRTLRTFSRDAMREWDRMGKVDAGVDRAMVDVMEDMDRLAKDLAAASGIVKSQMAGREMAFLSSDEKAARELVGVAEELA